MKKICEGCYYNKGSWCNRLVIVGGFGRRDVTAISYASDAECAYKAKGHTEVSDRPNFENS